MPYVHEPLDKQSREVRLITILPRILSAEVKISIHKATFPKKNPPKYEALSYVWGSEANKIDISVGRRGQQVIPVTQNLAAALRGLRSRVEPRVIWIDAVSINQVDNEEKSQQVAMMGEIYEKAHRVVVWLGEEADDSSYAIKTLRSLAMSIVIDYTMGTIRASKAGTSLPDWTERGSMVPYTSRKLLAIDHFIHRPWFERVWIRQEISLSRENAIVVCGSASISWIDLCKSIYCLNERRYPTDDTNFDHSRFKVRLALLLNLRMLHTPFGLECLLKAAPSKCTNPRDKVYGLLALIKKAEGDVNLQPDYSLSISQVYQNLVIQFLDHSKRLDILAYCEMQQDCLDSPTWAPSWQARSNKLLMSYADAWTPANANYAGNGVLNAAGILLDKVISVDSINLPSMITRADVATEIFRIVSKHEHATLYPTGGTWLEAFCRTVAMNEFQENTEGPQPLTELKFAMAYISGKSNTESDLPQSLTPMLRRFSTNGLGRTFFSTIGGLIGLGPPAAKPGDKVCVVLGCDAPLVIRETQQQQYKIVGECYVQGLMDSEAILGQLPPGYTRRKVCNRQINGYEHKYCHKGELSDCDPRALKLIKENGSLRSVPFGVLEANGSLDAKRIGTAWHFAALTADRLKEAGVNIVDFDFV